MASAGGDDEPHAANTIAISSTQQTDL